MGKIPLFAIAVVLLGNISYGFYYYGQLKKPHAVTSIEESTSYCENDGVNGDIYAKNTVTSGELTKRDRTPRVTSDRCSSEGPELPGTTLLVEVSCKNDIYVETKYDCGLGNMCSDGKCVEEK